MFPKTREVPDVLNESALNITQVDDVLEFEFENGALAGTVVSLKDLTPPETVKRISLLSVINPSTETDITVVPYLKHTELVGEVEEENWTSLGSFDVPASPDDMNPDGTVTDSGLSKLVHGAFFADGMALSIKIVDTIVNGFTVKVWIYNAD